MTTRLSESTEAERTAAAAAALIRTVRRAFRLFARSIERLHADLDVTAAMRVVLEMLEEDGAMTVPQMARQKGLTRQHFQTKVDALLQRGLVASQPNPAHARSVLIELTPEGRAVSAEMRRREQAELTRALADLDAARIEQADRLLVEFCTALAGSEVPQAKSAKED